MNVVCPWCLKGPQLSLMPNLLSDSRLGQSRPPDIRWLGQNIRFLGYSFSNSFRKLFGNCSYSNSFRKLFGTVFENCSRFFRKDFLDILFRKLFGTVFENFSERFSKTVRDFFEKIIWI